MIERFSPGPWWRGYDRAMLARDLVAGTVVAVMLVPQAMAYAMLAGLPPVTGLYAATFPLIAYACFGTSRQLAVGPVAMISLLAYSACSRIARPGSDEYVQIMAVLAVMTGIAQMLLGVLRAGFLINFVSHAVISGFTSAAAILIGLSQLRHLLGIRLEAGRSAFASVLEAASRIGETHGPTLAIGVSALAVILAAKRFLPRFPAALAVVAAGVAAVAALRLDERGVSTVGGVPGGLPPFTLPTVSADAVVALLPAALTIVFIGYMESIAVAKWIASREKYRLHPDRELLALGFANVVAGLFRGYPVTGGFSRTAVNYQSGARTQMAALATALLMLLTLWLLTPWFERLPHAVLAAVIIAAVAGLVDAREAVRLFRIKKADGWTLLVTFLATLALGIEKGLLVGILFSLVLFVARSSRPRTVVLGRVGDRDEYRDMARHPEAVTFPDVVMIRVDAGLYFANARFVEDRVRERLLLKPDARWVLMDMSGVNDIDAVAVSTLEDLMETCAHRGVRFAFAGMKAQVRDVVARAGWPEKIGEHLDYAGLTQALRRLRGSEPPNGGG